MPSYFTIAPLHPLKVIQQSRNRLALVGVGAPHSMSRVDARRTKYCIPKCAVDDLAQNTYLVRTLVRVVTVIAVCQVVVDAAEIYKHRGKLVTRLYVLRVLADRCLIYFYSRLELLV